jgi:predicted ATP-grasp superfamily ATP-dependent carboligase
VKPDDGAGCEDTRVVPEQSVARCLLAADPRRLVAQPWIEGEPASLSLVCAGDRCLLLACNRQAVRISGDRVIVDRLCVNGLPDPGGRLAALAGNVVSAIPGFWGYIGIDLILAREGPVVLEVNPRLTTSYCGLRGALGINVAAMVLGLAGMTGPAPWRRPVPGRPVEIALKGHP